MIYLYFYFAMAIAFVLGFFTCAVFSVSSDHQNQDHDYTDAVLGAEMDVRHVRTNLNSEAGDDN